MPAVEWRDGNGPRKASRSILSHEYVNEVLVTLLEKGAVNRNDLSCIITSPNTRSKVLVKMKGDHLLDIRMKTSPRKTYVISLTQYGMGIARKIREAYDIVEGNETGAVNAIGYGHSSRTFLLGHG